MNRQELLQVEAISVQLETLLSQLSHRTASQPHQPQGNCSGIINHHTTLTKLIHSETERKNETVSHLDVLRAGIVKDIYQLCEREKVGLLLLCRQTKSEIISLCDRKRGNNGKKKQKKAGIKSLWKRRRPRKNV